MERNRKFLPIRPNIMFWSGSTSSDCFILISLNGAPTLSLSHSHFIFLHSFNLPLPSVCITHPSIHPSVRPSARPSAHGHLIAANLGRVSLEGFSTWLCSTGLLNAVCGEGEWPLRGEAGCVISGCCCLQIKAGGAMKSRRTQRWRCLTCRRCVSDVGTLKW